MVTLLSLKKMISEFTQSLADKGFQPLKVILFGSYAKATPHENSDIDLAVWAAGFEGSRVLDIPKILSLLRPYPGLEIHTFNQFDTADTNPFIEEILRTGIDYTDVLKNEPDRRPMH